MKKFFLCAAGAALLAGCGSQQSLRVSVENPSAEERTNEMAEIAANIVFDRLELQDTGQFVIYNEEGNEVPYQLTYDEKVIFPVTVDSKSTTTFTFQPGTPEMVNTLVFGAQYPEWQDDLVWENDKVAFRAYGPDVQKRGQKAYGYDVFTKNVSELVMEYRYGLLLNEETWKTIKALRKEGKKEVADSIENSISYHVDHGTGMDCYQVGATLGAGTAALMVDSALIYPYCYKSFEILDNGPLRFTMKLDFTPLVVKNDSNVLETRIIQLDKGSYLNKTTVAYENLNEKTDIAAGVVIHAPYNDRYNFSAQDGYIAYADPTMNVKKGNGIVYVGTVFPKSISEAKVQHFDEPQGPALGHVLGLSQYNPGDEFVYYWGSGWSKGGFSTDDEWTNYLKGFAQKVRTPLIVTVE